MVSCKQVSCAEEAVQVRRRTPARRCYGPASDAEFLRSIAEKTPGRDDGNDAQGHQIRRRQVYLKSYVFASKEEAEAKATPGGRRALVDAVLASSMLLLRCRKQAHDDRIVGATTCSRSKTTSSTSSASSRWGTKKTGEVLSQLLTRLLSCACGCNPTASSS